MVRSLADDVMALGGRDASDLLTGAREHVRFASLVANDGVWPVLVRRETAGQK